MRLSTSYNVYRYYQALIFPEFARSFFEIYNYLLKNYSIDIDKNINFKIIYEMHFYNKRSYSRYVENSIDNVNYYYNIFIRLNNFITHFSYRDKESYLFNF